ncbi:MAG: LysR family transcriptional regulator [Bacteroidales bacterium]|nr:LysR family transcriptional regulator [Bacteroidales bacterium]
MITDNRLRIFVKLAESGSFTLAARRLGISQPAVSQCAAQLEAEAGAPLLVRGKGEVSLTPLGERFLLYSRRILALYDNLSSELSGSSPFPETAILQLDDSRTAVVSVADGKLQIDVK